MASQMVSVGTPSTWSISCTMPFLTQISPTSIRARTWLTETYVWKAPTEKRGTLRSLLQFIDFNFYTNNCLINRHRAWSHRVNHHNRKTSYQHFFSLLCSHGERFLKNTKVFVDPQATLNRDAMHWQNIDKVLDFFLNYKQVDLWYRMCLTCKLNH